MSFAKLSSSILAARDGRQKLLDRHLATGWPATILLSLNIPGENKNPSGAETLFAWALERLKDEFPALPPASQNEDVLGPWALIGLDVEAYTVKQRCVSIEEQLPVSRLIDLDAFDCHGQQLGRSTLNLPPRLCLLCPQPAVECMRLGRHGFKELGEYAEQLLTEFIEIRFKDSTIRSDDVSDSRTIDIGSH